MEVAVGIIGLIVAIAVMALKQRWMVNSVLEDSEKRKTKRVSEKSEEPPPQ